MYIFKKMIFICTFILIIYQVQSQSLRIGIKGGLNAPFTDLTTIKNTENSFHVGAFATIGIAKKWDIQPEVLLSNSNITQSTLAEIALKKQTVFKINYLSIPIAVRFKLAPFIHLAVGPQFSIVLNRDVSGTNINSENFKTNDFSLFGGIDFDFLKFKIYGRYLTGLTNLNEVTSGSTEEFKPTLIQVGIGFKFL